ncbi:MAG: hypothetical protein KBA31_04400 [Alphaproteobacteria bacterium]|nr:hypothetical protein [Alphaproteobacteria bacterium]
MSTASTRPPEVFSPRTAIILFLVGVFAFSAFITLSTFAPDFLDGDDAQAHALSHSAIGYAGIVKLARLTGANVTVSRGEPGDRMSAPLVVLTPESNLTVADVVRLAHTRALIVLPKWLPIPSPTRRGWVSESVPYGEKYATDLVDELLSKAELKREAKPVEPVLAFEPTFAGKALELKAGKITSLQTITALNLLPVVQTKSGKVVLGKIKRDDDDLEIYVLSDPDFLNTQGIANKQTATAAIAILNALREHDEAITFDVTLNGLARTRSLLRLAFEPPLLAATLSLVIVAALLAWSAATRSAPSVREGRAVALGKRTLADNSAALIRLAGRDHMMAARYADMIRTVTAELTRVSRDGTEITANELDRIAASRGVKESYTALAAEATAAQSGDAAVAAARKLHTWTEEMIRATR